MVFTHSCAQEMNSKLTVNNPSPFLLPSPLPLPSPSPSISFPTQDIHYFRPTLTADPPTLLHTSTPLPPQFPCLQPYNLQFNPPFSACFPPLWADTGSKAGWGTKILASSPPHELKCMYSEGGEGLFDGALCLCYAPPLYLPLEQKTV